MPSLNADLERVRATLASITSHEVVVQNQSVYVNYGYSEALVIESELTEHGVNWHILDMAWDRTHGVSRDDVLASVVESDLPGVVTEFLRLEAEREARLEAMLEQRPDDD